MSEQAPVPVREDIPFPNGIAAVPAAPAFQPPAAAVVAAAPEQPTPPPIGEIDPRLLAMASPPTDHGLPYSGAFGPSTSDLEAILREPGPSYSGLNGINEWTPEKLLELIRQARDLPYQRLMGGAELIVELAKILVADSAKHGQPIDFATALRSIHRISGMLSQRPDEFAALTTMFG